MHEQNASPKWNRNVKVFVAGLGIVLGLVAVYYFRNIVRYLVIAAVLAYVLNPFIQLIADKSPLKRNHSILLVYLGLIIAVLWGIITLGLSGYTQVTSLITSLPALIDTSVIWLNNFMATPIKIGPLPAIDLSNMPLDNLLGDLTVIAQESANSLLQRSGDVVGGVAKATVWSASFIGNLVLILIFSIYLSFDLPRMGNLVGDLADTPGYRADAERLSRDFGRIWRAYLRGQVTLAISMFLIVWITLMVLGVSNAFALGVLSGLMEFLPIVGPFVGTIVAIFVALFQAANWMGLAGWQLALLVGIVMLIIQQIENTVMVPRIVGKALDLHPLVTMIAVVMGTTIAGILGAVLAAPVVATIKLVGTYCWRKLFDKDPFPHAEKTPAEDEEDSIVHKIKGGLNRLTSSSKKKPVSKKKPISKKKRK